MRKHFPVMTVVGVVCLSVFLTGCVTENNKPTADFSYETVPGIYINTELHFSDLSTDEDGTLVSWSWDFGDGTTSTEQNPTHAYDMLGTYSVRVTVTDNEGAEDTATMTIEVTEKDIVVTAEDAGTFDTLVTALTTADLVETLKGEGPYTVFAPTDVAFDLLNQTYLTDLLNDINSLASVLTYHVLSGELMSADIIDGMTATTLEGSDIIITKNTTAIYINDATITLADINCSNGVIHVIDKVLIPE